MKERQKKERDIWGAGRVGKEKHFKDFDLA